MRYLFLVAGLLLGLSSAGATVISGSIVNLTGQPMSSNRSVVFTLMNCGSNIPQVQGSSIIVPGTHTMIPNPAGLLIGTLVGNDIIACGTVIGQTYYQVQIFAGSQRIYIQNYLITGPAWNIATAVPLSNDPTAFLLAGQNYSGYTVGDLIYGAGTNVLGLLHGNTASSLKVLCQTGTGTQSGPINWCSPAAIGATPSTWSTLTGIPAYVSNSMADPGVNGLLKRISANTVAIASSTDLPMHASRHEANGNDPITSLPNLSGPVITTGTMVVGSAWPSTAVFDYSILSPNGYARLISFGPDNSTNGSFRFMSKRADGSNTQFPMTITNASNIALIGNLGIGLVSDATYELQLSADSAAKPSTSAWTVASDRRLKTNVRPFIDGLSIVNQLAPVAYEYNGLGGMPAGVTGIGFLAQNVKDIIPYSVGTYQGWLHPSCAIDPRPDPCDTTTTELFNLNDSALTYVLINAVNQLELQTMQHSDVSQPLMCTESTRGQHFFVRDDLLGDHVTVCGRSASGTYSFQTTTQF